MIRGSVSDRDGPPGSRSSRAAVARVQRLLDRRQIASRPGHRSHMVERPDEGPDALQADTSSRGLQAGHDAAGGRNPDAASGVASECGEREAGGERRSRAAARTAHRALRGLRMGHRGGTHAEGTGVACTHAEDDGPGAAKLPDHLRVRLGTMVGEKVEPGRAHRRGGVDDVLDRDRDPGERSHADPTSPPAVGARRLLPRAVGGHVAQRAQARIQALDSIERPIRELRRADLSALQSGGGGGQIERHAAALAVVRPSGPPCGVTPACSPRCTARSGRSSRRSRSSRCR